MAAVAWNSIDLCTSEDVQDEAEDLPFERKKTGDYETRIQRKHKVVKELIGQQIDIRIPEIFASSVATINGGPLTWDNWVISVGYTREDLDSIKDKILNLDCLKRACVAGIILAMLRSGELKVRMLQEQNSEAVKDPKQEWKEIFDERLTDAIKLLRLDLDGDGRSTDNERPAMYNNLLQRV
jgi:hypothetical protein